MNNKIVYIGSSKKGFIRILSHCKDKDFDEFEVIECQDELEEKEAEYILKYKPFYNNSIPPNKKYISLQLFKRKYCLNAYNIYDLRKMIKKYNVNPIGILSGIEYYQFIDLNNMLKKEGTK